MNNNKQTAVSWLVSKLELDTRFNGIYDEIIKEAKQKERKQITEAYCLGHVFHDSNDSDSPEEYYNTEYGKDTNDNISV